MYYFLLQSSPDTPIYSWTPLGYSQILPDTLDTPGYSQILWILWTLHNSRLITNLIYKRNFICGLFVVFRNLRALQILPDTPLDTPGYSWTSLDTPGPPGYSQILLDPLGYSQILLGPLDTSRYFQILPDS